MDWDFVWKSALIVIVGTFLLRIAGKKTISQMTLAETVIMIAIGSLLIQPVAGKNVWVTFLVGGVLVLTLIVMEFIQVKSDGMEKLITGKSKVIIQNGHLQEKTLAKLRMTVDQLEMNLRQKNVSNLSDVKWATLEPNGQIGFILKTEAQPVAQKDLQELIQAIENNSQQLQQLKEQMTSSKVPNETMFTEIENKKAKKSFSDKLQ
ncbi:DUF421 domain-containing protein [Pontibacillus yanchengensis]|uniref:DUF421 domain-containing protein n=2 Tax=Pontibacillus yanchengensis TaxID=462910 RepID=A0A6I5A266_9BACI|nr:DUF421 domain-containing protein [Pontibacillus yanchengensis]MYL34662.1 DUF421 domain-containing protein [Pontibacillus yanchengensis]MYL54529.1 DUF421 domain-containing protein [Pontibacillus yanchengensis]